MTMAKAHWSVAQAKASLSRVLADAVLLPQVIERRGKPVAVVVSMADYEQSLGDPAEAASRLGRWRRFLQASRDLRAGGGVSLSLPRREVRKSPLGRVR
jgi:prevent-host-death family protein